MNTSLVGGIRRGLSLVILGITVQLGCALFFSPATFVVSTAMGVPLVLAGVLLFGRAATRVVPPPNVDASGAVTPSNQGVSDGQ